MQIEGRPKVERTAVHSSITVCQISDLVDHFYEAVQAHATLGPIFSTHITDDWNGHLKKMKTFWRSVLLRTGEYKGKPVPVHLKIEGIETEDFREWLKLFSQVSAQTFQPEAAALVNQAAERIATSLWLSRSPSPFDNPPNWADLSSGNTKVNQL